MLPWPLSPACYTLPTTAVSMRVVLGKDGLLLCYLNDCFPDRGLADVSHVASGCLSAKY
jgi:hypothetical protein